MAAFRAALAAADPSRLVAKSVWVDGDALRVRNLRFDLSHYGRIFVVGGGKATGGMAVEAERLLGERIVDGVINVPDYLPAPKLKRIRVCRATHPFPSQSGTEGVRQMLALADQSKENDLFVGLFSGGGSALMPAPAEGISLKDKIKTTDLLLKCGADIGQMNIVRRHLSSFKGGRFVQRLNGSEVVSLVISDVPGDRFDTVSSGPTAPDETTFDQARSVLVRHHIWREVPASVRALISRGVNGSVPETPKPRSPVFRKVRNVIIGSNKDARTAARDYLRGRGFRVTLREGFYQGEARTVGKSLGKEFLGIVQRAQSKPAALVAGGETTVIVRGSGRGGRDQEMVLSAAKVLEGKSRCAFAALATDGIDGPTTAAGAIADGSTVQKGLAMGKIPEAFIRDNDSNGYFRKVGGLLVTGPTGTNVNDIVVAISLPL